MTRPFNSYNSKAACEGGWEFYGRDDKVLPLEVVHAYIKACNGQDSVIPAEYLRQHPEILKDAGAGGTSITKADRGVGGSLPPRQEPEPQPKPKFDPVARSPYDPLLHARPKPSEKPERPFMPRTEYIDLNRSR